MSNDLFKLKEFLKSFILLEVRGGESNKGILIQFLICSPVDRTPGQLSQSPVSAHTI
jgi:hypothetical protein